MTRKKKLNMYLVAVSYEMCRGQHGVWEFSRIEVNPQKQEAQYILSRS
jgi:hypothetical protein